MTFLQFNKKKWREQSSGEGGKGREEGGGRGEGRRKYTCISLSFPIFSGDATMFNDARAQNAIWEFMGIMLIRPAFKRTWHTRHWDISIGEYDKYISMNIGSI